MSTNPFVSYADLVTGDGADQAFLSLFQAHQLSQQAWDMMNPQQQASAIADLVTSDAGGNFNNDAQLDPSQVEQLAPPSLDVPSPDNKFPTPAPAPAPPVPGPTGDNSAQPKGHLSPLQKRQREIAMGPTPNDLDAIAGVIGGVKKLGKELAPAPADQQGGIVGWYKRQWAKAQKANHPPIQIPMTGLESQPSVESTQAGIPGAADFAGVDAPVQVVTAPAPAPEKPDFGTAVAVAALQQLQKPFGPGDEARFTRDVYRAAGRDLPAFSEDQLSSGRPIDLTQARAGDLVARRDASGTAHLVGIYTTAGKFVAGAGGQLVQRNASEYAPGSIFAVHGAGTGNGGNSHQSGPGATLSYNDLNSQQKSAVNFLDTFADALSGGSSSHNGNGGGGGGSHGNGGRGGGGGHSGTTGHAGGHNPSGGTANSGPDNPSHQHHGGASHHNPSGGTANSQHA